jgi:hypothetical protein
MCAPNSLFPRSQATNVFSENSYMAKIVDSKMDTMLSCAKQTSFLYKPAQAPAPVTKQRGDHRGFEVEPRHCTF